MLFIEIGHASSNSRHSSENFAFGRRVFANRRREAITDRRHDWRSEIIGMAVFVAHSLGDPRLNRDRHPGLEWWIDTPNHSKTQQYGQQAGPKSAMPRGHLCD